MPSFSDTAVSQAPPEEVWKLLYDPSRFPEWWAGVGIVEASQAREHAGGHEYTMYPEGYPDFPMTQLLESRREERRVTVSCMVSDLRFDWLLEPAPGDGTRIVVEVEIPEREAHRLQAQQAVISASLTRLAELATATG
jgi:uncharacterized protein YndB with AHSA1/START domain